MFVPLNKTPITCSGGQSKMRSTNLLLILAVASSVYLQNESQVAPR